VAHPYLPQAVEVVHLQDPPAPAAGVHSVMAASTAARRTDGPRHGGGNPYTLLQELFVLDTVSTCP
jgi:hypothetical protein